MLRPAVAESVLAEYGKMREADRPQSRLISTAFPDALVACKKRYQTAHPELGITHSCNEACLTLMRFCARYRDHSFPSRAPLPDTASGLQKALTAVRFVPCTDEQRHSGRKITAFLEMYRDPGFVQIEGFISDFRKWVDGEFNDSDRVSKRIHLEPFQKNLLSHVIFFVAVTKMPVLANRVIEYLTHIFNIDFMSSESLNLLKQKATVFLVPRRHGKTWFTVPVICFLLKNIIGISVGYVAHQKHVSQFVLKEVEFRCRHMFGSTYTVENKDNVISIDHRTAKSTALFASCYNTNVSDAFLVHVAIRVHNAIVSM